MLPNSKSSSSSQMTGELDNMGILSGSHLGKAGPFLAALEQQLYQSIVPRRLVNEPSVPVDEAISMARQQQQTVDSDDDDDGEGSVWGNYFQVPYEADGPGHEKKEAEKRKSEEESSPGTAQRRKSVAEAFWFLRDFIEARWPVQLQTGYIKIQCDLTMDEVKELGRLNKAEGTKECRKLISVPVIHDEIGYALWLELAREIAAPGDAPGEDTQAIKARPVTTPTAPPTAMSKITEEDIATRQARSMRRRATDGDTITVQSAPRTASTHVATTSRTRRKSDLQLVRAHQVICTTCGSRAVPRPKSEDGAVSDDEYEDEQDNEEEEEDELEFKERKRDSISRRLSVKMNKTLTKFGEGLATGYGGNGGSRVTGQPSG